MEEEKARCNVQEVDDEVDRSWTAASEWTAKKMLKYLEDREALKVSTRELKEQVLSPDESSVSTVRIVRQARSEKSKKVVRDFQTRSKRGPHRQYGEMGSLFSSNVACCALLCALLCAVLCVLLCVLLCALLCAWLCARKKRGHFRPFRQQFLCLFGR